MIWVNAVSALLNTILSVMYFVRYRDGKLKSDLGLGVAWAALSVLWLLTFTLRLLGKI